jgi:hypothetical protein
MAYARIDERFWTDPMIKGLSAEGKLIAAWLFTNPHRHFSGIYYLPRVLIADEVGVSVEVCNGVLEVLENNGFMKYDDDFSVVWVTKMLHHQSGGVLNEKQAKGISTHLDSLHGCPMIKEFLKHYQQFNIPYNTPINTPTHTKSQSQSKSKSKEKDIDPSPPPPKPSKTPKKKPTIPLPEDFGISDAVSKWAEKEGFGNLDKHLEAFIDYVRSSGKQYVDYDAAFRKAIREDWGKIRSGTTRNGDRPRW